MRKLQLGAADEDYFAAQAQPQTDKPTGTTRKRSQAKSAVPIEKIADALELWHTPDGRAYATIRDEAGRRQHFPVDSDLFKKWLAYTVYKSTAKNPTAQAIAEAVGVIAGRALYDGSEHEIYTRVAPSDGAIVVFLANENLHTVCITEQGYQVQACHHIRFRKSKNTASLPVPESGDLSLLDPFVGNVSLSGRVLIKAWLVQALRPSGPYPVLIIDGPQGSGKSFLCRLLKRLIDPTKPALRRLPDSERDLAIAASNSHVLAFDNLSGLRPTLSDAFCSIATGGGWGSRQLYTNDEESVFDYVKPVILNGIDEIASRPDLVERAVIVHLDRIPEEQRATEAELLATFKAVEPQIFGALCGAVSLAVKNLPRVSLGKLPRMADFALWATAAEPALGCAPGGFMTAYADNQNDGTLLGLDADPLAGSVREYIASHHTLSGSATEILALLAAEADESITRSRQWPTARKLKSRLTRLAPALLSVGIKFSHERVAGERRLTLKRSNGTSSLSSSDPQPQSAQDIPDDDHCDNAPARLATSETTSSSIRPSSARLHAETPAGQGTDDDDGNDDNCRTFEGED